MVFFLPNVSNILSIRKKVSIFADEFKSRIMIQNPYALDSDGNLVSANAAEKHEIYFCVTCGGKMYLAGGEGKQMQAHFRHESGVEHSGETFLHDYTKRYFACYISIGFKLYIFVFHYIIL